MSLEIDFHRIRTHNGSKHGGFEELCCQLASFRARADKDLFIRHGLGADAGIECLIREPSGNESGWQTKYFFQLGRAQIGQLDKSISRALASHPRLTRYTVCIPFDLRSPGHGTRKSDRDRWTSWHKKWTTKAKGRSLKIELWDRSKLVSLLTSPEAANAGRLLYWFDELLLTQERFGKYFDTARVSLGNRYSPETHIELPIRQSLLFLTRDPCIQATVRHLRDNLQETEETALRALDNLAAAAAVPNVASALEATLQQLLDGMAEFPSNPLAPIPLPSWCALTDAAERECTRCLQWIQTVSGQSQTSEVERHVAPAQREAYQLSYALAKLKEALNTDSTWQLANRRRALIFGEAGMGKSHLLADVTEHQIKNGRPAILILGETLVEGDIWDQIRTQLDLQHHTTGAVLGAFDAAAQAAGVRALIVVDAINERHGLDIWPSRLRPFLRSVEPFSHLALVVSCRSTYLDYLVEDDISEDELYRVEHVGLGDKAPEAARIYFASRGLQWHGTPTVMPEFQNPLFVRVLCDALQRAGEHELPRGMRGITKIFTFYIDALDKALTRSMRLDPYAHVVRRAIRELADAMSTRSQAWLPVEDARWLLERVHPSNNEGQRSLLLQLAHEGILAIEPRAHADGTFTQMVRFTFERFSDHIIAGGLLDRHLDPSNPAAAFGPGAPLQMFTDPQWQYRRAGVLEALAIQLPERAKVELPDAMGAARVTTGTLRNTFFGSLQWRDPAAFSDRTLELLAKLAGTESYRLVQTLIAIATDAENAFNADYLCRWLLPMSMPERDQVWSTATAAEPESNTIQTLIAWISDPHNANLDAKRARLAASALVWLLSTSHRFFRDRATKALSILLSTRIKLAAALVRQFGTVNDPYIQERLFAAAYGAVLQGRSVDGLGELAHATYDMVFASGEPPIHILIRDYARGIIEYAAFRGCAAKQIDLRRVRPLYRSTWPLETLPESSLDAYRVRYGRHLLHDQIVSSTTSMGDFGHYVINGKVTNWSDTTLDERAPRKVKQTYERWEQAFASASTPKQKRAFTRLLAASCAYSDQEVKRRHRIDEVAEVEIVTKKSAENPLKTAREKAAEAFRKTLDEVSYENFRIAAQNYISFGLFEEAFHQRHKATFDTLWAQRWVCKRAHDLGWTVERFGEFDRSSISHGRNTHRIERIGKKYQWIAFHELLARLSDNLFLIPGWQQDDPIPYEGPWQVSARDMDPSLLVTATAGSGWSHIGATWWSTVDVQLAEVSPQASLAWLHSDIDVTNGPSLIDVQDPQGRRWLVLDTFRGGGIQRSAAA